MHGTPPADAGGAPANTPGWPYVAGDGSVTFRDFRGASCGALRFQYDPRGRLRAIIDRQGPEQRLWCPLGGALLRRDLGGTSEECAFDELGRMMRQSVPPLVERSYHWNHRDGLVAVADASRGARTFRYDETGALIGAGGEQGARQLPRDATGTLIEEGLRGFQVEPGGRVSDSLDI